jgi:outer membrane receptor protein involved in Fe transport
MHTRPSIILTPVIFGCAGLILFTAALPAQTRTAVILGTVRDASGSVVPNAALEVRNTETNEVRKTVSDGKGEFTVPDLVPGHYQVNTRKEGFRLRQDDGIVLQVEQVARMELTLEVGAATQSVTVTAAGAPLINTDNGTKGEVMASNEILEMPLNGRSVTDLALLVPEVLPSAPGQANGGVFAIGGARSNSTDFVLDGFNAQSPTQDGLQATPNIDSVQEFKMQTNGYSSEFGRMGGGVMTMVLKTGGNQPHGSLFEFVRNDFFDARGFFDKAKAKLRQNQFGASLGGPVILPKIYRGRDRTFFFFSWESYRQTSGQSQLGVVPTAAQRLGNFAGMAPLKDPFASGTFFPANQIPVSLWSPVSAKAQAYYPQPNQPQLINNYLIYGTLTNHWDAFDGKIDEHLTDRDTVTFRILWRNGVSTNPFFGTSSLGQWLTTNQGYQMLTGVGYTHVFSPTVVNEARFGVSRNWFDITTADHNHNYAADFGLPSSAGDPRLIGMPYINVSGVNILGSANNVPQLGAVTSFNPGDTLTWVKGRHLFKFGVEALHTDNNVLQFGDPRGTYNITNGWTGQSYGDFLLGLITSDSRQSGVTGMYMRTTYFGAFGQDDWKITDRLTLNFGLRYDLPHMPSEKYGATAVFVPGVDKLVIGTQQAWLASGASLTNPSQVEFADKSGLPPVAYTRYNDLAPRFGFAWRPFGGNRSVIRGGYGIFFAANSEDTLRLSYGGHFPFLVEQTFSRNTGNVNYLTFANPFPTPASNTGNLSSLTLFSMDPHAPTPNVQNWNLTAEREIGHSSALEISYSGSKGTHLPLYFNLNQQYWPQQKPASDYPGFGTINYYAFEINSIHNAGTVVLRRRFVHGFFYTTSYTFSKTIDEGSEIAGGAAGSFNGLQNIHCFRCMRGRADFDIPHAFTMSFSWVSPARNMLLKGWQLAGSGQIHSGIPFMPTLANVSNGQPSVPNRIAKGTVPDPDVSRWFNIAAFPAVPPNSFQFGNAGRGILDGPGQVQLNSNFSRNFALRERSNLQLRWELFNALNHANFGLPVRTVDTTNAATLTSVGSGRLMQFAVRYVF